MLFKIKILTATMLLLCWTTCCQAASNGVLLKKGTPAPFSGYLFSEKTTQQIAEGWKVEREQNAILAKAYDDLKRESLESIHALQKEIVELNDALLADERRQQRARHRRSFWTVAASVAVTTAAGFIIHHNR